MKMYVKFHIIFAKTFIKFPENIAKKVKNWKCWFFQLDTALKNINIIGHISGMGIEGVAAPKTSFSWIPT